MNLISNKHLVATGLLRNKMAPLCKAGSILPDNTTTTGLSDNVTNINPFQIISAEKTIMAKFSTWKVNWRLLAQSFLSSYTCLSIISLIMVAESRDC